MAKIPEITRFIRDYGHEPRHLQGLTANLANWNQIWSACDVIDDAELAIDAYEGGDFESGTGQAYLAIYGLLQVLFVQQDAVLHLCEALLPNLKAGLTPRLTDIRDIRNLSIGHPTKKTQGRTFICNHISRPTLNKDGFQLLSFSLQGDPRLTDVSVLDLVQDQRTELVAMLEPLVEELKARDRAHKAQFRGQSLEDDFVQVPYAIEKIYETIRRDPSGMGAWAVGHLEGALSKFEDSLKARGQDLETYDVIKHACKDIAYPLAQLKRYIAKEPCEIVSDQSALVFVGHLEERIRHLLDIVREVDADYQSSEN